jgi:hypothetical protein
MQEFDRVILETLVVGEHTTTITVTNVAPGSGVSVTPVLPTATGEVSHVFDRVPEGREDIDMRVPGTWEEVFVRVRNANIPLKQFEAKITNGEGAIVTAIQVKDI